MDILSLFFGGWLVAIFAGLFFISMVVGCSFDRRHSEASKWWVFWIGVIGFTIYQYYQGHTTDWKTTLFNAELWKFFGIYLAIGLGYSILEFMLEVRRSVRRLSVAWAQYKSSHEFRQRHLSAVEDKVGTGDLTANSFVADQGRYKNQIIGVEINPDLNSNDKILPKVNRIELAESIGCWMIFWPFYAVSLIIGDLVFEIARAVADVIAKLSGRFVRMAFKNVFKY